MKSNIHGSNLEDLNKKKLYYSLQIVLLLQYNYIGKWKVISTFISFFIIWLRKAYPNNSRTTCFYFFGEQYMLIVAFSLFQNNRKLR